MVKILVNFMIEITLGLRTFCEHFANMLRTFCEHCAHMFATLRRYVCSVFVTLRTFCEHFANIFANILRTSCEHCAHFLFDQAKNSFPYYLYISASLDQNKPTFDQVDHIDHLAKMEMLDFSICFPFTFHL